jgi:hypothetical protein
MNKTIPLLGYTSWCGLGFIRGVKSYTYQYEKTKTTLETYLYLNAVGYGCCGILFYANPFLMPLSFYKEIYRLEVTLRQLEKEKHTDYYSQLF